MERSDWSRNKFGKWDLVELEGEHYSCCKTPWPAKYYACSFCKREFRSAQALGGHMNVHRKDRARLRLLSSWVLESQNPNKPNSNPNPNPNPNSINSSPSNSLSSHSANFSVYPHHSSLSTHFTTPSSSGLSNEKPRRNLLNPELGEDLSQEKTMTPFPGVKNLKMHAQNYELEVGGLRRFNDSKQVLDLELRLGHI